MYDLNLTSSLHVRSDGYLLLTVKETIQIEWLDDLQPYAVDLLD
jgi:hypothetical protein